MFSDLSRDGVKIWAAITEYSSLEIFWVSDIIGVAYLDATTR